MIQIRSGETSRPLATSSLIQSLRDLIKARFRHYSINDRGTYERSTWSKSTRLDTRGDVSGLDRRASLLRLKDSRTKRTCQRARKSAAVKKHDPCVVTRVLAH